MISDWQNFIGTHVHATDLSGLTAVITDDVCDERCNLYWYCQELRRLNCHKVVLYVTHGIFSKGIEVFNGLLDQLFTSDSLSTTTIRQNFSNCFCSKIKRIKMTIKLNPLNAIDFYKADHRRQYPAGTRVRVRKLYTAFISTR